MTHMLLASYQDTGSSGAGAIGVVLFLILFGAAVVGYILPGIIASLRSHHNSVAIWVLTILAGWTFLGWLIALIWSLTNSTAPHQVIVNTTNPKA